MVRLKNRQKQIPGGFRFWIAPLRWQPSAFASFDTIVAGAISALKGNPAIAQKLGWDLSTEGMAERVDQFNAQLCQVQGWTDYITAGDGGQPANPFPALQANPASLLLRQGERAVAGVSTIAEMFGPDGPVKDQALAEKRAVNCTACYMNEKGDWTRFFTVPAQNMIRSALEIWKGQNLKTEKDSDLRICTACGCPLKLKVWARLDHILKHMPQEDKDQLADQCWIRNSDQ